MSQSQISQFSDNYASSICKDASLGSFPSLSSDGPQSFIPDVSYDQQTSDSTSITEFARPPIPPPIPSTLERVGPQKQKNYHFIHLTYQEYFATRYFVRKWKDHGQPENVFKRQQKIDPAKFLQRHKYSTHYDVFWRFVSGLLDSGDKRDMGTPCFFQNIEEGLCDLLGPVHQRLVMHCLNELVLHEPNFSQFQSKLEDQLSQWLLFECKFMKKPPQLTRERELSDWVLLRALAKASDEMKILILKSLISRPVIQASIIEWASSWLNDSIS